MAITVALPLVLLGGLEATLRALEYGGNLRLVERTRVGGREVYRINRAVGRRYFAQSGTTIPEPKDDVFSVRKGARTFRIFCLGESTMAGFPYDFHATAPSFLRDRLQNLLPEDTVEVINVGLSAVGSYVILDFARELLDYEPDLLLVYAGHNEFYGAYGVGSVVSIRGGPWMTRLTLSLLRFRSFLLFRNVVASFSGPVAPPSPDATLMEQVVGERIIPLSSPLYAEARGVYRDNLERMIDAASSRGVPVMFCALVSNLRAQPPFRSVSAAPADVQKRRDALLADADSLLARDQVSGALNAVEEAVAIDSGFAASWYRLGNTQVRLHRDVDALHAFRRAKDADALRFRATEEFQQVLLDVCAHHGVTVVRLDSAFATASPHGITGSELITEHLHPNLGGYFLMAKNITETIRNTGILGPRAGWHPERDLPDSLYFDRSTVSAFDSLSGAIRVLLLTHRWPFVAGGASFQYTPPTPEAAIVCSYVRADVAWSRARYELADLYARTGRFALARRECLAIAKAVPTTYEPLLRVADLFRMEGNAAGAEEYYLRSITAEDNPFSRMKLGIFYLERGNLGGAEAELSGTLALERRSQPLLDRQVTSTVHYLLAVVHAKRGRFNDARSAIRRALEINPANDDARDLLRQIAAAESHAHVPR
jgi:tetratricopeptide (TPR) repeat protein